jgi:anti-anti-sigma factor
VAPSSANKEIFVVRVDGSVDTLTADELDNVIGTLVRQRRSRLVIDLAGANYISSAGWGIFISRLRVVRESGGDLKLARMTAPVRDVYDLLELDGVLSHFDRLDTAESQFGDGNGHSRTAESRPRAVAHTHAPAAPVSSAPASLQDTETGHARTGRFAILRALWGIGLAFRHQRFRYYRRQMRGPQSSR